ncbi:ATP-binding cassette domain-containing protein [Cereibacter sphaeroides]|uniref:ATP-binding cassette domain-containing protein n=1 Tax=Cereibacter sphaeroides TaxID=1063 RepID=UPI003AEFB98E
MQQAADMPGLAALLTDLGYRKPARVTCVEAGLNQEFLPFPLDPDWSSCWALPPVSAARQLCNSEISASREPAQTASSRSMTEAQMTDPIAGPAHEELALQTRGLVRRFGTMTAVAGIDLDTLRGKIFAIVGPSGAVKTSLLRVLATLIAPGGGRAWVLDHNIVRAPQAVRASISMTGQFASLDEDLTARENLLMLARLWGFGLPPSRHRSDELLTACSFSTGRRPGSIRRRDRQSGS